MSASITLSRGERERENSSTGVPLLLDSGEDDFLTEQRRELESPGVVVLQSAKNNGRRGSFFRRNLTAVLVFTILVLLLISSILAVLFARKRCFVKRLGSNVVQPKYCVTAGCIGKANYMLNSMDRKAKPCEDFFQYSCGGWQKKQRIPESKAFWGVFSAVWENNQLLMKGLLDDFDPVKTQGSAKQKLKIYYDSCMNLTEVNLLGAKPLQNIIQDIGGWIISSGKKNRSFDDDGQEVLKKIHKDYGVSVFFSTRVETDDKNSSRNIIVVSEILFNRQLYIFNLQSDFHPRNNSLESCECFVTTWHFFCKFMRFNIFVISVEAFKHIFYVF